MRVLGIETSCDETAVAIVDDHLTVRTNLIASQIDTHARFGGVVPEVAARMHVETLNPLIAQALEEAGCGFDDLDAIATTIGPGLVGALLVGVAAGKSISLATKKPFIGVNHLEGHIYANFLELGHEPEPPYVCLVVSGGHTMLVHMRARHDYVVLGQTLDDAAGEAFDKVARSLGLGFPGGPALDRLAQGGDPAAIRFPRAMADSGDFDFSMSGLKTAVMRHVQLEQAAGCQPDPADLAASFQEAIVDVQVTKTIAAARECEVDTVLLGGGVVANSRLRERMTGAVADANLAVVFPSMALCTDNAAMIACAGSYRLERGDRTPLDQGVNPWIGARRMSTVLVTGGAGFIGSNLCDRLLAEDHKVIAVDDLSTGKLANLADARGAGKQFSFQNFDIRADGLQTLFEHQRLDAVIHLAANPSVPISITDPMLDASANVLGLLNVLQASVAAHVGKVLFATSGGTIYGEPRRVPIKETAASGARPLSPYGITKKVADDYLRYYQRQFGLEFTSLALANVYGPRQDPHGESGVISIFIEQMLANETPTIYGDGNQTRDFVYVDDVVHAFVLALEGGSGKLINVGTGLESTVNGVYQQLARLTDFDREPVNAPKREGELRRSALDNSLALEALGWKPWTHLEDGLAETVAFFKGI